MKDVTPLRDPSTEHSVPQNAEMLLMTVRMNEGAKGQMKEEDEEWPVAGLWGVHHAQSVLDSGLPPSVV